MNDADAKITNANTVNAAIKHALDQIEREKPKLTEEQEVLQKAKAIHRETMLSFKTQYQMLPVPPTLDEAIVMIYKIYKDKFRSWNRDDLLVITAQVHAMIAADTIREAVL